MSRLLFSSVWYLERQQHQLCECQSYYSPVSGIWKDSNTSCVSVKVTILQCLVSGKTATPAVLVSMLLFSSVWYLERQQHQLCECQSYYSPVSGIWKDSNTSCVSVNVTILQCLERQQHQLCECHCYFSPVSGIWKDSNTSCVSVKVTILQCLERQQHQLCECQSYYSPVSGIWKDSNTSCVSVKVTILQCLERQQHQLAVWYLEATPAV